MILLEDDKIKKPEMPIRISKSSRDTWINCPQAYYFRKICGIDIKPQHKSIALKFGTIWDKFINSLYDGVSFRDEFIELANEFELSELQIAIIQPMIIAFKALGLHESIDKKGESQYKFDIKSESCIINGVIDVKFDTYFEEHKFSGSPNFYTEPFNISEQLSTYFLSDKKLKKCIMKIAKKPTLRIKQNENVEEFHDRVVGDIISKPSSYFIGYNRKLNDYGINYYRDEFSPLQDTIDDYNIVTKSMMESIKNNWWYQKKTSCFKFGTENACQYHDICKLNVGAVNPDIYTIKTNKLGREG